uniref:Uncharacterized protein n=1 Tax=Tanacetum cinerariifolium TaxID=118510 RepID=A0A699GH61_TANCI|nr:hypothetical protein [Tanacetum cinerariifolium]
MLVRQLDAPEARLAGMGRQVRDGRAQHDGAVAGRRGLHVPDHGARFHPLRDRLAEHGQRPGEEDRAQQPACRQAAPRVQPRHLLAKAVLHHGVLKAAAQGEHHVARIAVVAGVDKARQGAVVTLVEHIVEVDRGRPARVDLVFEHGAPHGAPAHVRRHRADGAVARTLAVDACAHGEVAQRALWLVGGPQAHDVFGREAVERQAAAVDVFQVSGLVEGVAGKDVPAFEDFTADLGVQALAAHLAGIGVAVVVVAAGVAGAVILLRAVFLHHAEQRHRGIDAAPEQRALHARFIVGAHQRFERSARFLLFVLRREDVGVAGIRIPVRVDGVDQSRIRRQARVFALVGGRYRRRAAGGHRVPDGARPAHAAAHDQLERVGQLQSHRAVRADLARFADPRFAGGGKDEVFRRLGEIGVEAVDVEGVVIAAHAINGARFGVRVGDARHQFVAPAQRVELAGDVGVHAGQLVLGDGVRGAQRAATGDGIDRHAGARVLHVVLLLDERGGDLQRPVVVEVVRQVRKRAAVAVVLAVPRGAQEGGAGQIEVLAVAVAGQAVEERAAFDFFGAERQVDLGLWRHIVFERGEQGGAAAVGVVDKGFLVLVVRHHARAQAAVGIEHAAGVELQAVVVPRSGLGHHLGGVGGQRPFAHQVDGAARIARALQQARRAAQHFHAVVDGGARVEIAGAAIHAAVERHAVVLHGGQVEAARINVFAALRALLDGHARGAGQGVVDGGEILLVEQLARDHADRLRNVLQCLLALADADRAGGVGASAFGDGAGLGGHRHRHQGLHGGVFAARGPQRDHGAVDVGGQAAVLQQQVQRIARGHAPVDGGRGFAGHQRRLHHQLEPGLARQRIQRGRQRLRGNADFHRGGGRWRRTGLGMGAGGNSAQGEGDGQRQRRTLRMVRTNPNPATKIILATRHDIGHRAVLAQRHRQHARQHAAEVLQPVRIESARHAQRRDGRIGDPQAGAAVAAEFRQHLRQRRVVEGEAAVAPRGDAGCRYLADIAALSIGVGRNALAGAQFDGGRAVGGRGAGAGHAHPAFFHRHLHVAGAGDVRRMAHREAGADHAALRAVRDRARRPRGCRYRAAARCRRAASRPAAGRARCGSRPRTAVAAASGAMPAARRRPPRRRPSPARHVAQKRPGPPASGGVRAMPGSLAMPWPPCRPRAGAAGARCRRRARRRAAPSRRASAPARRRGQDRRAARRRTAVLLRATRRARGARTSPAPADRAAAGLHGVLDVALHHGDGNAHLLRHLRLRQAVEFMQDERFAAAQRQCVDGCQHGLYRLRGHGGGFRFAGGGGGQRVEDVELRFGIGHVAAHGVAPVTVDQQVAGSAVQQCARFGNGFARMLQGQHAGIAFLRQVGSGVAVVDCARQKIEQFSVIACDHSHPKPWGDEFRLQAGFEYGG